MSYKTKIRKRLKKIILITIGLTLGCGLLWAYWFVIPADKRAKFEQSIIHYFSEPSSTTEIFPSQYGFAARKEDGTTVIWGTSYTFAAAFGTSEVKGSDWIPFGIPLKPLKPNRKDRSQKG